MLRIKEFKSNETELINHSEYITYQKCYDELAEEINKLIKENDLEISKMNFQYIKHKYKKDVVTTKYYVSVIVTYYI